MLLKNGEIEVLHEKYAPSQKVLDLVLTHCTIVNEIAQWCAGNISDAVDIEVLRNACLLHDVGTYILFDDSAIVSNSRMYPQHAILGAKILQDEGLDEAVWQAVETHVLMGLSKAELLASKVIRPGRCRRGTISHEQSRRNYCVTRIGFILNILFLMITRRFSSA